MKILKSGYDLVVEIFYLTEEQASKVAASKNLYGKDKLLPHSPTNVDVNTQMYADFEAFLIETLKIFRKLGFIVNEEDTHFSDKSNTTYYITATHPALGEKIRCVFYLRISTHDIRQDKETLLDRENYYTSHTQELYPDVEYLEWKLSDIRVNDRIYKSYRQAEVEVEHKLNSWIEYIHETTAQN